MVKQMSGHGSFSHKGKSRSEGQRGAEKKNWEVRGLWPANFHFILFNRTLIHRIGDE